MITALRQEECLTAAWRRMRIGLRAAKEGTLHVPFGLVKLWGCRLMARPNGHPWRSFLYCHSAGPTIIQRADLQPGMAQAWHRQGFDLADDHPLSVRFFPRRRSPFVEPRRFRILGMDLAFHL